MHAELLTIGSELLSGVTVNTNAAYLARRLGEVGVPCRRQVAVADTREALGEALRDALGRAEIVLTTGGLGPTFDDVTMEVIAHVTRRPLVLAPVAAAAVRRFYTKRHRRLQQAALRQARLPLGGITLPNPLGTAPGLWLPLEAGRLLIALPGVPAEMRTILERSVLPRLKRRNTGCAIESRTLRTIGIVELSIEAILRRLRIPRTIDIGLYPHLRMVDVRLTVAAPSAQEARRRLGPVERRLRRALGATVYGSGEDSLEEIVGALLLQRRCTLGLAESCTGGLVTDRLTNVPGSSRYIRGAIVGYANEVKRRLLGVPRTLLAQHGAVSAPVARAMAQGARRALGADLGVALTGIAGPSGGSAEKPVGLVFIGFSDGRRTIVKRLQLLGNRTAIKTQAAQAALNVIRLQLMTQAGSRPARRRSARSR